MTIQEAIKKAIDGGWDSTGMVHEEKNDICNGLFLDPLFWKALGKAMWWGDGRFKVSDWQTHGWLFHWHRLIDHLAEGKSVESFFEQLKLKE